jgi:hypothetical protein
MAGAFVEVEAEDSDLSVAGSFEESGGVVYAGGAESFGELEDVAVWHVDLAEDHDLDRTHVRLGALVAVWEVAA